MRQILMDVLSPIEPFMPYTGALGLLLVVAGVIGMAWHALAEPDNKSER